MSSHIMQLTGEHGYMMYFLGFSNRGPGRKLPQQVPANMGHWDGRTYVVTGHNHTGVAQLRQNHRRRRTGLSYYSLVSKRIHRRAEKIPYQILTETLLPPLDRSAPVLSHHHLYHASPVRCCSLVDQTLQSTVDHAHRLPLAHPSVLHHGAFRSVDCRPHRVLYSDRRIWSRCMVDRLGSSDFSLIYLCMRFGYTNSRVAQLLSALGSGFFCSEPNHHVSILTHLLY